MATNEKKIELVQDSEAVQAQPAEPANAVITQQEKEELDADEAEFRALRRDLPGVKGASGAGIVNITVAKAPPQNEFFRVDPNFRPILPMVNIEVGMERHYYAVAKDMIATLGSIGITVSDHTLYFTVTTRGAYRLIPIRTANDEGNQNEYARTKEISMLEGMDGWVRLYTDEENKCYKVFPAPAGKYGEPQWPDLKPAKIIRLGFRDKGRLIDSTEHPLFRKWAATDE